jgi:error-prone DNA polymerase
MGVGERKMPDPSDRKVHAHPFKASLLQADAGNRKGIHRSCSTAYAELAVTSNFTFLSGASHPDELVTQAARLGYAAVAVTDTNSLAGVVRAHVAAKDSGIPLLVGCRLRFTQPGNMSVLVYPTDRQSYGRLCRLLTVGKRRAPKGECHLTLDDLVEYQAGLLAVVELPEQLSPCVSDELQRLREVFDDDRLSIACARLYGPNERRRTAQTLDVSESCRIPLVAVNNAHYHDQRRRALQDVLTCIRHGCTIDAAGFRLHANAERHLKSPTEMARLFAAHPRAVERTVEIAERARGFDLDQLRYEYPDDVCPSGSTPMEYLRHLTLKGSQARYPDGVSEKVRRLLTHEFDLIEELRYAPYFLTVYDIVRFARSRDILCQGRGAAANSAVCYCLGITAVDPDRIETLFERFVCRERHEPPDIDIDFSHRRREEVIQYLYCKYGRDRAALTATVITYRSRSTIRDVGKALGLSLDAVDRLAKHIEQWRNVLIDPQADAGLRELGFDPTDHRIQLFTRLVGRLVGFPRHLSQHVGGFVITRGPLCELVPVENAAMPDRTVIEWDKDDGDAVGMLRVDVLGLGMLTCLQKGLDLIREHHGRVLTLATIPAEDPDVYRMISAADTIGVFQVESRAQRVMSPLMLARCYYDLVIQIALVRPGPIVGDMVHPYLRRRSGKEKFDYPNDAVRGILEKTLCVPVFQEQVMRLAVVAAGFTPGEAELLRRAIAAWKSSDVIALHVERFIEGMLRKGYEREFAEWCAQRLKGFSEYGFPESHSASFALLVYASAWIKLRYPAAFAAALLNSQPMGFYAPAQIVRDAAEHHVDVRPVDVAYSRWDCTLEDGGQALRLGMCLVKGVSEDCAQRITNAIETHGPFQSLHDLRRAANINSASLRPLARADAFRSLGLSRQQALWAVGMRDDDPMPLFDLQPNQADEDSETELPRVSAAADVVYDYQAVSLSLKGHPLSFLRESLAKQGVVTAKEARDVKLWPTGKWVRVAGLVLFRQRPGTAKGIMFATIEDETAQIDLIVRPDVYNRDRQAAIYSKAVIVLGCIQREDKVVHIIASRLESLDHKLRPV